MRQKGDAIRQVLIVLGDSIFIPVAYFSAFHLRLQFGDIGRFGDMFSPWFMILTIFNYLLIFYFFDLYGSKTEYFSPSFAVRTFLSVLVASVSISFLYYGFYLFPIGRGVFILANLIILALIFIWRILCQHLFKFLIRADRILFVGFDRSGQEIAGILNGRENEYDILGFVGSRKDPKPVKSGGLDIKYLGSVDILPDLLENQTPDLVVLNLQEQDSPLVTKHLLAARFKGVEVVHIPKIYQNLMQKVPIDFIQEDWFLDQKGFERAPSGLVLKTKRIMDIAFSSIILILSLPLWPFIALAVKINSRGPVFYTQNRIGKNEVPFCLFKFRSMIDQAEENGAVWADENDARITAVGKFLRRLHLDELPQLINVLKGEMSLVGPRPERPEFVSTLKQSIPYYSFRHFVKPGLTGWAQVSYPYASSLKDSKEKLEYDLFYITNMNLLMDLRILLRTFKGGFPRVEHKK